VTECTRTCNCNTKFNTKFPRNDRWSKSPSVVATLEPKPLNSKCWIHPHSSTKTQCYENETTSSGHHYTLYSSILRLMISGDWQRKPTRRIYWLRVARQLQRLPPCLWRHTTYCQLYSIITHNPRNNPRSSWNWTACSNGPLGTHIWKQSFHNL